MNAVADHDDAVPPARESSSRGWKFCRIFVVAGLPLFWAVAILLSVTQRRLFLDLTKEDGMIEALQVVVLAAAALVTAAIAWRLYRRTEKFAALVFAGVTFGLVCITAEEISWGQRILDRPTSGFFARHNKQGETNFHNLKLIMPLSPHLSSILLVLLIALSLRARGISRESLARRKAYLWMPPAMLLAPWLCYASYRAFRTARSIADVRSTLLISRLEEPGELIFYIGLLAFAIVVLSRVAPARAG